MTVEINNSLVSSIVGGRHNKPLGGERLRIARGDERS